MDEMLHYYECKGSKIISLNDLLWPVSYTHLTLPTT